MARDCAICVPVIVEKSTLLAVDSSTRPTWLVKFIQVDSMDQHGNETVSTIVPYRPLPSLSIKNALSAIYCRPVPTVARCWTMSVKSFTWKFGSATMESVTAHRQIGSRFTIPVVDRVQSKKTAGHCALIAKMFATWTILAILTEKLIRIISVRAVASNSRRRGASTPTTDRQSFRRDWKRQLTTVKCLNTSFRHWMKMSFPSGWLIRLATPKWQKKEFSDGKLSRTLCRQSTTKRSLWPFPIPVIHLFIFTCTLTFYLVRVEMEDFVETDRMISSHRIKSIKITIVTVAKHSQGQTVQFELISAIRILVEMVCVSIKTMAMFAAVFKDSKEFTATR